MKRLIALFSFIALLFVASPTSFAQKAKTPKTPSLELPATAQELASPVAVAPTTVSETGKITPPFEPSEITATNAFIKMVDPIYSALLILFGLLSAWIPGLRNIDSKALRVAAIGIVMGIGFITFGGMNFWQVALSTIMANWAYITSIKPIVKSVAK